MQLRIQDLLLSAENLIAQQLRLYIFKAKTRNRVSKTLPGLSLLAEQQQRFFDDAHHFFLIRKYFGHRPANRDAFPPTSAQINLIAEHTVLDRIKVAFTYAAPAVVTGIPIDLKQAVLHFGRADRTNLFNGTFPAAIAGIFIIVRDQLSDHTQIIQIRLHTVVRTSAHCDFELMREQDAAVALIKAMVNLLRQSKGVDQAVLAGGSLTGYDRADL